jgi:hypothetical protein
MIGGHTNADAFAVLGVARGSDLATCRAAYTRLVRALHPDKAAGRCAAAAAAALSDSSSAGGAAAEAAPHAPGAAGPASEIAALAAAAAEATAAAADFVAVQAAWEALRDGRASDGGAGDGGDGDALPPAAARRAPVIAEEIAVDALAFDALAQEFVHRCRCGGEARAPASAARERRTIAACDSCSLTVAVMPATPA